MSTTDIDGRWYRVTYTENCAVLDVNALQGWAETDLMKLARRVRVCVPDCLIAEVVTKEIKLASRLLDRLSRIRGVFVKDLGAHCRWEIRNRAPVGLLLNDDVAPGFPERAYLPMVKGLQQEIGDKPTLASDFIREVDLPNEQFWKRINTQVLSAHEGLESAIAARRAGLTDFLEKWFSYIREPRPELERGLFDFLSSFQLVPECDVQTLLPAIDEGWVIWRVFSLHLTYFHLNSVQNPGEFNHKRLNQRIDMHYLALLGPGMILATQDKEMAAIARGISPLGRVISQVDEIS